MGTAVICHLTSVHTRFDTRIFVRECRSLTKKYDVRLVVADGEGDAFCDGVQIVDVGKFRSRLLRIGVSTFRIFAKVLSLRPALVHIHDPELIVVAWLLNFFCRAHVVYDIHDDVRSQLVEREWVVAPRLAGWLYSLVEKVCASSFSLVLAELSYLKTYGKHKRNIATVLNYPDINFLTPFQKRDRALQEPYHIFYVGGLMRERCLDTMLDALLLLVERIDIQIHIVGDHHSAIEKADILRRVEKLDGRVHFYGRMPAEKAFAISRKCQLGLALLRPVPNYLHSYPSKIFEYMAIGLPFVVSNFPLYETIVSGDTGGVCADPENPSEVADAILGLLTDVDRYKLLQQNGIKRSLDKYNWCFEEKKLYDLYDRVLSGKVA